MLVRVIRVPSLDGGLQVLFDYREAPVLVSVLDTLVTFEEARLIECELRKALSGVRRVTKELARKLVDALNELLFVLRPGSLVSLI